MLILEKQKTKKQCYWVVVCLPKTILILSTRNETKVVVVAMSQLRQCPFQTVTFEETVNESSRDDGERASNRERERACVCVCVCVCVCFPSV